MLKNLLLLKLYDIEKFLIPLYKLYFIIFTNYLNIIIKNQFRINFLLEHVTAISHSPNPGLKYGAYA